MMRTTKHMKKKKVKTENKHESWSEDDDDVSFDDQTRENNEKTLRPRNIN